MSTDVYVSDMGNTVYIADINTLNTKRASEERKGDHGRMP